MRTNDAQMLVLCTLADGPLHGYAINAAIEKLSGDRLGPGSLYGALTRLEDKELIEPLAGEGRQRPVRLTAKGREVLERELRSLAEVTDRMFEAAVPDRIGYLDRLAGTDVGRSYKRLVLDALDIRPGQTVLDMGCGPGTDLAALAEAVTPSGAV
ncbi:helix-turn-helix transcriptional regulator, partial [Streptomyces sp. MCAF7]